MARVVTSSTVGGSVECPDEQAVLRFAAGALAPDRLDRIDAHIDGCAACARLVVDAVQAVQPRRSAGGTGPLTPVVTDAATALGEDAMPSAIGRYAVLSRLGRGGMGTVYEAYDPRLDRRVAIKVIRRDKDASARHLRREGQALASLAHPNVVAVFEVGTLSRTTSGVEAVYLAMELVEGCTLRQWVAKGDRTEAQIVAAYTQAGRGLAAAHALGIVHRDFKPDNVLVGEASDADGLDRVRVTDFGLARLAPATDDSRRAPSGPHDISLAYSEWSTVAGTPAYMAPEQRAAAPVDGRADQYAFCVSLWEALCGVRSTDKRCTAAPRSARLRRALERGLRPDPARRWPSMDALLRALRPSPRRRAPLAACLAIALGVAAWAGWRSPTTSFAELSPADVAAGVRGEVLRERLRRLRDAPWGDQPQDNLRVSETLVEDARAFGDGVLLADVLSKHADVLVAAGRPDEAKAAVEEAHLIASAHGADRDAAFAATQLMFMAGVIGQDLDEAFGWARHAEAAIVRMPASERPELLLDLATARGNVLEEAGRYDEALAEFENAVRYSEEVYGVDHPDLILRLNDLGSALMERDRVAALDHFHRALTIATAEYGEHDANVGIILASIGVLHGIHGDLDAAAEYTARALEVQELAFGARHPQVGTCAFNLGEVQHEMGDDAAAEASYRRALEIWSATFDPNHIFIGHGHAALGEIALSAGELDDAEAHYQRSLLILETALGPEHPDCIRPLAGLAEVALATERGAKALRLAERALALGDDSRAGNAATRFYVAKALWQVGRRTASLDEARATLEDASAGDDPTQSDEEIAENVQQIEQWIAEHEGAR